MKNLIKKFIPSFLLDFYHYSLAAIGALLYCFPSRKMVVVGITGTSGKSTVVEITAKILEEAGYKTASLSSIKFKIGDKESENKLKMTMPGRFKIQRFLKQALNAGCKYAVLEVTSEGIKQFRHKFIDFDVAVFTNLSPEHIESHGGFGKYRKAKSKLFKTTKKVHIINLDDKNAEYFLQSSAEKKWGYAILNSESQHPTFNQASIPAAQTLKIQDYQLLFTGSKFFINDVEFNLGLLGKFNIYNALAAICVALSQNIPLETCKAALEKVKIMPGRAEVVIKKPFTVVVDYAHTPAALEKIYKTASNLITDRQAGLICVLGACGGGRDKWKRSVLGEIAAKYCKEIIVTNEDPYDEEPIEIIKQVAKGTKGRSKNILGRREAIKESFKLAEPNDVVIITGKGSEPLMCVAKGKKISWDDRKIVKEEFKR